MDIWLIVSYIGVLLVGGFAGYRISNYILTVAFAEMLNTANLTEAQLQRLTSEADEDPAAGLKEMEIRVELVNGNMYCYEKHSNQFLGQAATTEELIGVLGQRLGDIALNITPEDGAQYITGTKV
jgi:hypothetical protein